MKPELRSITTIVMVMLGLRLTARTRQRRDRWQFASLCSMAHSHPGLQVKTALFCFSHAAAVFLTAGTQNLLALFSLGVAFPLRTRFIRAGICGPLGTTIRRALVTLLGCFSGLTPFWCSLVSGKNLAHASITTRSASILGSLVTWEFSKVFNGFAFGTWFHHSFFPPYNHYTIDNGISQTGVTTEFRRII